MCYCSCLWSFYMYMYTVDVSLHLKLKSKSEIEVKSKSEFATGPRLVLSAEKDWYLYDLDATQPISTPGVLLVVH